MSSAAASIPVFTLNNGRPFPSVGLGTWAHEASGERDQLEQAVYDAIAAGIRHIDTAWIYKVEASVGAGVKRAIADGLVKREDLVVVTKVWVVNLTRDRLLTQAAESLASLGLEYIDVLLVHWPVPMKDNGKGEHFPKNEDGSFAIEDSVDIFTETWAAMEECVDKGITKSIGVSNFTPSQIDKLVSVARIKPVTNQIECNPLLPQEKLIAACAKHGIVVTAYQPFGGSPRPQEDGSTLPSPSRQALFESPVTKAIAERHGKTVAQVLLNFHVQRGVAVLFKSVNKARIQENLKLADFELSPQELQDLTAMKTGQRCCYMPEVLGSKYNPFSED